MTAITTDVAIIGAGPVGLFAVFECGMLGMNSVVIDSLEAIGGQCAALYPEKPIYDIPAYPQITGAGLVDKLAEQAAPFTPTYLLNQQVVALEAAGNRFRLRTSGGTHINAGAVLIAAGAGAFGPNRPPLNDLEGYEASGAVQYVVRTPEAYRHKRLVIAGGGDSAIDWALALHGIASHITVVHRRPKFRAAPESVRRVEQLAASSTSGLALATPYQLCRLEGNGSQLSRVIVATLDGEERALSADILLPFYGLSMDLGPIAEWGLSLQKSHIPIDQATAATNIDGIYAIGDVATYPHKLKLILTGFAEAASAAHSAYNRLNPETPLHFEYSTSRGIPQPA